MLPRCLWQFREPVGVKDVDYNLWCNFAHTTRNIFEIFGITARESYGKQEGFGWQKQV